MKFEDIIKITDLGTAARYLSGCLTGDRTDVLVGRVEAYFERQDVPHEIKARLAERLATVIATEIHRMLCEIELEIADLVSAGRVDLTILGPQEPIQPIQMPPGSVGP